MADKPEVKERPVIAWILSVLILFLGIAALISGPMLFLSPDGSFMQMSTDVLKGSPFPDYLIPGIILFLGLLKTGWRGLYTLNPFTRRQWAWTGSIAVGVILLIWIITETVLLGYVSFLQPVMGMWGLTILLFTALPGVRKYHAA
jgi:hypothetical protein